MFSFCVDSEGLTVQSVIVLMVFIQSQELKSRKKLWKKQQQRNLAGSNLIVFPVANGITFSVLTFRENCQPLSKN